MSIPFEEDFIPKETYKTALPAKSELMFELDANRAMKELQILQESLLEDHSDPSADEALLYSDDLLGMNDSLSSSVLNRTTDDFTQGNRNRWNLLYSMMLLVQSFIYCFIKR